MMKLAYRVNPSIPFTPWSTGPLHSEERWSLRLCVNFQGFNWIQENRYPLLLIFDLLDAATKTKSLHPKSISGTHTTLCVFTWRWMEDCILNLLCSFGVVVIAWRALLSAPAFSKIYETNFRRMIWRHSHHILDDILIYSEIFPRTNSTFGKYSADSVLMNFFPCRQMQIPPSCPANTSDICCHPKAHMALYKVQIIQDWPVPQKSRTFNPSLALPNFYCHFIYRYSEIHSPAHASYPQGYPLAFLWWVPFHLWST